MGKPLKSFIEILDPNFINSDLIGGIGTEKVVTIKSFEEAEYYDMKTKRNQMGSAVYFEECLPLLLNATNTKTLKKLFSPDEDNPELCIGHKVILYVTTTTVAREVKNCIRIKEFSETKCDSCGKVILPASGKSVADLIEISKRNCEGKSLCVACMKKYKEEKERKE